MPVRDPEVTSRIMSKIRSKNTKHEVLLGKAMWGIGLRYRKHYKIKGKPDYAFVGPKVVVFCDGDFWHGRDFEERLKAGRFKNNKDYWVAKISRNKERDIEINKELETEGWLVLRYWESDILVNCDKIANEILGIIKSRQ